MTVAKNTVKMKITWPERIANGFGSFGYFFLMIQWLALFAIYFTWIYTYFISPMQPVSKPEPSPAQPVEVVTLAVSFSPTSIILLALLTIVMVGIAVYAIIALPKMVSQAGSKAAKVIANQAAPLALKVKHKPETKKNRLKISSQILIFIKATALALPVPLAWLSSYIDLQTVSTSDAVLIMAVLAVPVIVFFAVQYIIICLSKTPLSRAK